MRFRFIFPAIAALALIFTACDGSSDNLGKEIQPVDDRIILETDTFHLQTETVPVGRIVSKPDSLLLGTYVDDFLGITRGDFLTQFAVPTEDFTYLEPSVAVTKPDSVELNIHFNSYFGVATSPIEVSVYELKKGLDSKEAYFTDLDPQEYVDFSKKINAAPELLTIRDGITGEVQSKLRVMLSEEFMHRFYTTDPAKYKTQEAFLEFFKGLYVTTNFGSSAMINIAGLSITLHYHYIYNNDPTQAKIKSYQRYAANSEVVRVNRIQHPYRTLQITPDDEYNYLVSPSNYHAKVRIPIGRMRDRISVGDKRLDINSATIRVDLQDRKDWGIGSIIPFVQNVLLIRESELDNFFKEYSVPSDTVAFLASLAQENITATTYKYSYRIGNMSNFVKHELKKESTDEYIDMVLVPVTVKQSTSQSGQTVLTGVVQSSNMQAASIFSGKHKERPIRMEVIYSGF